MKLQRISDERLAIKNLKNIRIAYALQTLGMLAILGYNLITNGIDGIKESPLWIVFIASTVILAFLSLTTDERLISKNLQKIRIAYAVQIIGIVGILGFDFIADGMNGVKQNPLWIVFILSTVVLAFLSMNTSVDYEDDKVSAKKGLTFSTIAVTLISIVIGALTSFSDGFNAINGVLIGLIFLVCGLIPFIFLFAVRNRQGKES
ncbi:hypothetical protein ACLIBG_06860 [Virgibacillus sp. W0181]|uniref:hypothetical protein n=1 Tax=Virgibacillus sp. W0181 TaxID=3391581 RepID=UPI003F44B2B9